MRRIVVTGAPGSGKTTLLAELARRGHPTVPDTARALIATRRAAGLPPRPEPEAFARALLDADRRAHDAVSDLASAGSPAPAMVFFDRCGLESLGMLHEAAPLAEAALQREIARWRFHDPVFLLPPWPEIYTRDTERDHNFEHALRVHEALLRWYPRCGWRVHELPRADPVRRADLLLGCLRGPAHTPNPERTT